MNSPFLSAKMVDPTTATAQWRKLGRIYDPQASQRRHPKLISHAANPLAVHLEGDVFRIYYSSRDEAKRSSVSAIDYDIVKRQLIHDPVQPYFLHGPDSSFYGAGVSIGCTYRAADGNRYMLFMGWQNPPDGHWRGDIGKLLMHEDGQLDIADDQPLIGASEEDPISLSYPWVCGSEAEGYRMWYGSTVNWDAGNGEMLHIIKQASSTDGLSWQCEGQAIPYKIGHAQAFSRPTVLKRATSSYDMWFSYRSGDGTPYRIGYAYSQNGTDWVLDIENAGIAPSAEGWDDYMLCYPFVFSHKGKDYMLYNGNDYGKTGFGLAVLED